MADYWISQNRKYCDFCRCWITDNKPSVDFHEKGRRHQENVKKRLRNITKQSAHQQRVTEHFDATIRQIESAALQSYRKDVESGADISSAAINKHLKDNNLTLSGTICSKKLWQEAKDSYGKTYYQNIITNEKVYQPPKEGYLSLAEQKQQADLQTRKQLADLHKFQKQQGLLQMQETKQQDDEERARLAREQMKARRVVDDEAETPTTYGPLIEPGKIDPYGSKWEVVKEETYVDLQLPKQEYYEPPQVVEYEPEPLIQEFKEKTVESLDSDGGESSFRKRKIKFGVKRNTRQRLDDD